jgi:hypothetical protein
MGLMRNAPAAVALDFVARRRRPGWLGWLLVVLGLAAVGAEAVAVRAGYRDLAERERVLERLRGEARAARSAAGTATPGPSAPMLEPALRVAAELEAPWGRILEGLANARSEDLAPLELQGDASAGTLRLVGQARSLDIAFDYVASLQSDGALRDVRVDGHEWALAGEVDVVRFSVSARWGAGR